jgi:hypothetical protein
MRFIKYPAEHRLEVYRLEGEFMRTPQGKGWHLHSVSREEGAMILASYPAEFLTFLGEHGIQVVPQ